MTKEQEAILLKHQHSIRARAGSADVLAEIVPLYRELSGDTNFKVKPGCRGCIEDLLNYLNLVLLNYEKAKAERSSKNGSKASNANTK